MKSNPTSQIKLYDGELQTVDKNNVEIFAAGTWNGDKYDVKDLYAMVDAFDRVGFEPPIKAGHEEGQENGKTAKRLFGEPALGYVAALRIVGDKLYADLKQIPKRFADLINAGAFKRISSEVYWDYTDDHSGKTFPRVLKAIAFLGAKIPALTNLKAIESLYQRGEDGRLFAYEGERQFRLYDYGSVMEMPRPKKDKISVKYGMAGAESAEKCATCKFYQSGSCYLVEGDINPQAYCSLYEAKMYELDENKFFARVKDMIDAALSTFRKHPTDDEKRKRYTVEKRGEEWCLISKSTGKTLGCHPTREKAIEQEQAIKANMEEGPDEFYVTLEAMKDICPECADKMEAKNFSALKVTKDDFGIYQVMLSQATVDALCAKFGAAEEFKTKCMASSVASKVPEPGAFCNALKRACHANKQKENSKEYKSHDDPQGGKDMDEKEVQALLEKQAKAFDEKLQAMEKSYEGKLKETASWKGDLQVSIDEAKLQGKKEAESEFQDALESQTKQLENLQAERRSERINRRLDLLKRSGKVPKVWENRLRAVFEAIPDDNVHKYTGEDKKAVEEPLAETLWKILEHSPINLFRAFTLKDPLETGDTTFSDPVGEVEKRAQDHMEKTGEKNKQKAYSAVFKADRVLETEYNKSVTGRSIQ